MPGLLIIGTGPLLPVQLETMIFVFVFFLIFIHSEIRVRVSQVYLNSPFFFADPMIINHKGTRMVEDGEN